MASIHDVSYSVTLPLPGGHVAQLKSVFRSLAETCKLVHPIFVLGKDKSGGETITVKVEGTADSVESFRDMTEFVSERYI